MQNIDYDLYHIAVLAPLKQDYETARVVLDVRTSYHDYQMQNGQIRPTLNRLWSTEGVLERDARKWVDRKWRHVFRSNDGIDLGVVGWGNYWRILTYTEGRSFAKIDKAIISSCVNFLRPPVMDMSNLNYCHIAIVAPSPEDYETARALLDEPQLEFHFMNSGAACTLGKVGLHDVVLVGRAEDMANVSVFVKDTVQDLLEAFPSIRAGFLVGVDATAPEESLAKPGDIVVAFPQGFQPGQVQFDAHETIISERISTTFEMSHPSSYIKSVINTIQSPEGRQHWAQYLQHQSSQTEFAFTKDQQLLEQNVDQPNKVLRGKVASSAHLLSDRDLAKKIGCDSKITCFERAGASIKSRFPILTVCGILGFTGSSPNLNGSALRQIKMATVIYTMFVSHRLSTAQLEDEYAFTDRFQYKPFDLESAGFRLVLLEKGAQTQLRCQIVQAYLDKRVILTYEALSYSWGRQTTLHEIVVNGKVLSITESLHEALYHLRNPDEDRMLWVDALCIDQNNIKERGHQVNRMGEIYKKADRVIIWLGYLSGGNVAKFKSAVDIFKDNLPLHAFREWAREDERWQQQWKQTEASIELYSRNELVDGLQIVMGNPWFSRVWILQEVANAKRAIVECNLGNIPARLFTILPYAMDVQVGEQCQAVLDIMPSPLKDLSWGDQDRSLCDLLWKFKDCQATDPRDRVYALLGMASDLKDTELRAEYDKDERAVMQDLCDYLLGDVCPAQQSLATNIRDLQAQLPAISRELLLQKIQLQPTNNSLRAFLRRQAVIETIDSEDFLDLVQHGSRIMRLFLDKSKSPIQITQYTALKVLETSTDVLEFLWKSPDLIIESLPNFVARAMEYDAELMCRLLGSSSNPEQSTDHALMEAISIGMPSCQPFLKYCNPAPKITAKLLRKAMVSRPEVLPHLMSATPSPVQLLEDIYFDTITEHPRGFRIIDEDNEPIEVTKGLIIEGAEAGKDVLEIFLEAIENPIELEEDLLVIVIPNGLRSLMCLTKNGIYPFNITKRVYQEAIRAGSDILDHLFHKSARGMRMTESLVLGLFEELLEISWMGERTWDEILLPWNNIYEKVQMTDELLRTISHHPRGGFKVAEYRGEDVPEDKAISAIKNGPEAFIKLLDQPGSNFRVTDRIRQIASEHMYAFEVLRVRRQSEVFPEEVLEDRHGRRLIKRKLEAHGLDKFRTNGKFILDSIFR
ncbi:hypothetical protein FPRO06_01786 [Fusarium proliferatum]|nr:hypothetical protein FPRO06_01786 [Fusarium proliferatum]